MTCMPCDDDRELNDLLDKLKLNKDEGEYCDCHKRCPKCGRTLRPMRSEQCYSSTSLQITWDSNSG